MNRDCTVAVLRSIMGLGGVGSGCCCLGVLAGAKYRLKSKKKEGVHRKGLTGEGAMGAGEGAEEDSLSFPRRYEFNCSNCFLLNESGILYMISNFFVTFLHNCFTKRSNFSSKCNSLKRSLYKIKNHYQSKGVTF